MHSLQVRSLQHKFGRSMLNYLHFEVEAKVEGAAEPELASLVASVGVGHAEGLAPRASHHPSIGTTQHGQREKGTACET